jgi:hypothetical protein
MPIDTAVLQSELAKPAYASAISHGNDAEVVRLLNAVSQDVVVADTVITRPRFILAVAPALLALAGKDATAKDKWDRVLAAVVTPDSVELTNPTVQYMFGLAVADGLLTQAQLDQVGRRPGSVAEILGGPGTSVTLSDVSFALRGSR